MSKYESSPECTSNIANAKSILDDMSRSLPTALDIVTTFHEETFLEDLDSSIEEIKAAQEKLSVILADLNKARDAASKI